MNNLTNLNLTKNPFENITPSLQEYEQGKLIWAGITKLISKCKGRNLPYLFTLT